MAKKIVKPTEAERRKITGRLQQKYPQMYESIPSAREKHAFKNLSADDKKTLMAMVGKRLKKIYRKK